MFFFWWYGDHRDLHSFPTRRSSDLAPKKGLRTELEGKNIGEWSKIFLNLSKKGLEKRNQLNKNKKNETIYLNYLNQILNSNQTNAELMLSKFNEDKDLNYLYEN